MKAKIKKTGEIVDIKYNNNKKWYETPDGEIYSEYQLDFYYNNNIDWEQRKFELVKAIIPGILSNGLLIERLERTIPEIQDEGNIDVIVSLAIGYADDAIAKLKEE